MATVQVTKLVTFTSINFYVVFMCFNSVDLSLYFYLVNFVICTHAQTRFVVAQISIFRLINYITKFTTLSARVFCHLAPTVLIACGDLSRPSHTEREVRSFYPFLI